MAIRLSRSVYLHFISPSYYLANPFSLKTINEVYLSLTHPHVVKISAISAAGWLVQDALYANVDYRSPAFQRMISRAQGDGGLPIGALVFADVLKTHTGLLMETMRREQGWAGAPTSENLGGPCAVGCVIAAQIFPVSVSLYAALGDDSARKMLKGILEKTPVNLKHVRVIPGAQSPTAWCLSDPSSGEHGERSFIVTVGLFSTIDVDSIVDDSFFSASVLFFGATALTKSINNHLTALMRRGREMGKINVVSTVFDFFNEARDPNSRWKLGDSDETYKLADCLIVDMDEALGLSGEKSLDKAVLFFIKVGLGSFLITHGAKNITIFSDGRLFRKTPPKVFPACDAVKEHILKLVPGEFDSTGCGDNFAGAVLGYIANSISNGKKPGELDLQEALSYGVAAGGCAHFHLGGTLIEHHPGEKRDIMEKFQAAYVKQIAKL